MVSWVGRLIRPQSSLKWILYWLVAPGAIVLLAWQSRWLQPYAGFDGSWMAGLEMAAHNGLVFGRQVVFTYGPLGFLSVPGLWRPHLAEAAMLYTLALRFGFALALFASLRRTFGGIPAFVIAVVVASVDSLLLEVVGFLIVAVGALTSTIGHRSRLALMLAAGAFAGVQLLDKVSVGISLAAMTAVLALSLPGRRAVQAAAALLGFVVALLGLWLAIGQPLNALPDYIVGSVRVALGWTPAVSIEAPGLGWQFTAAFIALGLGVWGAWQIIPPPARARQRWGVVLLWVVFWFFAFKEGFVRHDQAHAIVCFDALLGGFVAFRWRGRRRLAGLVGISALVVFALAAQSESLTSDVDPVGNARTALTQLRDVFTGARRAAITSAGRAEIEGVEPVNPLALSRLRGHTVAVWPSEIALAWAYGLDWEPLPNLQSYTAFTTALDRLDAKVLSGAGAPQRILFQAGPGSDGRVTSFDEGLTSRAILCRYKALYAQGAIAVLARGPNRCSDPVPIGRVRAGWGQVVPVPPPPGGHGVVSVSIDGVGIGALESVESFFYRPAERFIRLDGGPPRRLVAGTAADGLPLRASPGADYPSPFNLAVDARTIAVLKDGASDDSRPLTFRFYAQTLAGGPRK